MKAAILWELNKALEIRDDVGLVDLGPGQVHLKLVSSGVCHSNPVESKHEMAKKFGATHAVKPEDIPGSRGACRWRT